MKLRATERTGRPEAEAAHLRRSASMLRDLADTVSRGRLGTVDVPRQLRRLADSLDGQAETVQQMNERSAAPRGDSLSCFQKDVHRLQRWVQNRLRAGSRPSAEDDIGLEQVEWLLGLLCEACSQLADEELRPGGSHVAMLSPTSAAARYR